MLQAHGPFVKRMMPMDDAQVSETCGRHINRDSQIAVGVWGDSPRVGDVKHW